MIFGKVHQAQLRGGKGRSQFPLFIPPKLYVYYPLSKARLALQVVGSPVGGKHLLYITRIDPHREKIEFSTSAMDRTAGCLPFVNPFATPVSLLRFYGRLGLIHLLSIGYKDFILP